MSGLSGSARDGMSETSPERRVTFLFDVDNTLIDNDRAKADLSARIAALLGVAGERRFWELYEEVRHDLGLVNIPLILARYGDGISLRAVPLPWRDAGCAEGADAGSGCRSLRRRCNIPATQDLAHRARSQGRWQRSRLRPQARAPG